MEESVVKGRGKNDIFFIFFCHFVISYSWKMAAERIENHIFFSLLVLFEAVSGSFFYVLKNNKKMPKVERQGGTERNVSAC